MPDRLRVAVSVASLTWLLLVPVLRAWSVRPQHLSAAAVTQERWQQAREQAPPAHLVWTVGQGAPPLLPARGDLFIRGDMVGLNGVALVPGTFGCREVELTVDFAPRPMPLPGRLQRPLMPFVSPPRSTGPPAAGATELLCGVRDPGQTEAQGLHVRWGDAFAAYGADGHTPLFPGRRVMPPSSAPESRLTIHVDDNHILASAGAPEAAAAPSSPQTPRGGTQAEMDFHATSELGGAVGIAAYDGVVLLRRIEIKASR